MKFCCVKKCFSFVNFTGFGYGGHHLTYMALDNSRLVKGLIYLNPALFGNKINPSQTNNSYSRFEDLRSNAFLAEIFANFHATGFLRLADQLGIATMEDFLDDYTDFSMIPSNHKDSLISSLRSGSYFSSQVRENYEYLSSDFARGNIDKDVYKKKIGKSLLIIQGSNSEKEPVLDWFPKEQFLKYSPHNVLTIDDATYKSLVLANGRHMKIAAEFIKDKLSTI